ncbi:MAG: putative metal-binding motif-containing protein [Anaerolineaceae bacterium]|jgi:hypothetical protein
MKKSKVYYFLVTGLVVLFVLAAFTRASVASNLNSSTSSVPAHISYQGLLTNLNGSGVTGDVDLTFKLYNTLSGGSALWTETQTGVHVANGLFQVYLGKNTPLPGDLFNGQGLFLGVTVNNDGEMTPRTELSSAPYAFAANFAPPCGQVDNYYPDYDHDGFGASGSAPLLVCQGGSLPTGYVKDNHTDCNDLEASINPGADEICGNGIDDNCNGQIDEPSCVVPCEKTNFWIDADGDGFGDPHSPPILACIGSNPPGYVDNDADCNDGSASMSPAAPEVCNGIDDDCDGQTDEGSNLQLCGSDTMACVAGVCTPLP